MVNDGALTLTTVAMLRPHLTLENHDALFAAARHKSKREVEQQIAGLAPKPDSRTLIRRIPEVKVEASGPLAPAVAVPIADVDARGPMAPRLVSSTSAAPSIVAKPGPARSGPSWLEKALAGIQRRTAGNAGE